MNELQTWLSRAMEALWLLTVFLIPLASFDYGYAQSETVIAYLEVPEVALLRTSVGLIDLAEAHIYFFPAEQGLEHDGCRFRRGPLNVSSPNAGDEAQPLIEAGMLPSL